MGSCVISGAFQSHDWRAGINRIKREIDEEYGRQEGYSGMANCVNFCYYGDKPELKKPEQVSKFIDKRLEHLGKRDGEIVRTGTDYVNIITTDYREVPCGPKYRLSHVDMKAPATLMEIDDYDRVKKVIASGTIADMKKIAHEKLRASYYEGDTYFEIVCHRAKKYIECTGKYKTCKTTARKSNDKSLVVPVYRYIYYGWAPE